MAVFHCGYMLTNVRLCGIIWIIVEVLVLLAKERHQAIASILREQGAVTVTELTARFGVSIETIRRDLLMLEQAHLLQRVHGGAMAIGDMRPFHELSQRLKQTDTAKRELSHTAAALVKSGDVIGVDAGSTAVCFAEALREEDLQDVTVVTHSLDVFELLCRYPQFRMILCGGYFLKHENTFYGQLVLDTLKNLHMQKVFLFPSAVSLQYGICDHQEELYALQRQLLECGDAVYVLADSSKFEQKELLRLSPTQPHYTYVTDSGLRPGLKSAYADRQIQIITDRSEIV